MATPVVYVRRELTITVHADGPIPGVDPYCEDIPYVLRGAYRDEAGAEISDTRDTGGVQVMAGADSVLVVETRITRERVGALTADALPASCRGIVADLESVVSGD